MRFFTALSAGLAATTVSALPGLFDSGNEIALLDDKLKVPGDNPLKLCSEPDDWILDLENVDLDPNPPKPGKNLTVTAKGVLSEAVEEGATVHLQVKYGVITIIRQTLDLCNTVKNVNLECPIEKGETEITKDVAIPQQIPPGRYTVTADVFTKDDKRITCLKASVEFTRGGSTSDVFKQGL